MNLPTARGANEGITRTYTARPLPPVISGSGIDTPITTSATFGNPVTPTPSASGTAAGLSVVDPASGGSAMSGIQDLFSGIGHMFSDATHPGTGATSAAETTQAPASQSNMLLLVAAAVALWLIFK